MTEHELLIPLDDVTRVWESELKRPARDTRGARRLRPSVRLPSGVSAKKPERRGPCIGPHVPVDSERRGVVL